MRDGRPVPYKINRKCVFVGEAFRLPPVFVDAVLGDVIASSATRKSLLLEEKVPNEERRMRWKRFGR